MAPAFSASRMHLIKNIFSQFQKKDPSPNADFRNRTTMERTSAEENCISLQSTDVFDDSINNTVVACENNIYKTNESLSKELPVVDKSAHTMNFHDAIANKTDSSFNNDSQCINDNPIKVNKTAFIDIRRIFKNCYKNIPDNDECISEVPPNLANKTILNIEEFDEVVITVNSKNYAIHNSNSDSELTLDEIDDFLGKLNESNKKDSHSNIGTINNKYLTSVLNKEAYQDEHSDTKSESFDVISLSSTDDDLNTQISCKDQVDIVETISISSEDDNIVDKTEDSDCSGYHSSDFEFISESEAKLDGFIINYTPKETHSNCGSAKTIDITLDLKYDCHNDGDLLAPGVAGPSRPQGLTPDFEKNGNEGHILPEGEDYLKLFQGVYAPVLPVSAYFLENKSIKSSTCMLVEFEGMGFDMKMVRRNSSDEEYKNEADESAKKILSMYPGENRKRRRRF